METKRDRFQGYERASYDYLSDILERWETFFKAHDKLADAINDVLNWNSSYRRDIDAFAERVNELENELEKRNDR